MNLSFYLSFTNNVAKTTKGGQDLRKWVIQGYLYSLLLKINPLTRYML